MMTSMTREDTLSTAARLASKPWHPARSLTACPPVACWRRRVAARFLHSAFRTSLTAAAGEKA